MKLKFISIDVQLEQLGNTKVVKMFDAAFEWFTEIYSNVLRTYNRVYKQKHELSRNPKKFKSVFLLIFGIILLILPDDDSARSVLINYCYHTLSRIAYQVYQSTSFFNSEDSFIFGWSISMDSKIFNRFAF